VLQMPWLRALPSGLSQSKNSHIKEVEEIQAIEEATREEDFEGEDNTLITPDVGELLVIQRALHV